jgi:NAD(P)H-dependent FMN reductase
VKNPDNSNTNQSKILSVSGSSRQASSNSRLLDFLPSLTQNLHLNRYLDLHKLPLFMPEKDHAPFPDSVVRWRNAVSQSDGIILCTPEYIHNIPAILKNALEWVTSSGELANKPVLVITYTPHEPRGSKAMQSLLWSLQALDARVLASLPLFHSGISIDQHGKLINAEDLGLIEEALKLF